MDIADETKEITIREIARDIITLARESDESLFNSVKALMKVLIAELLLINETSSGVPYFSLDTNIGITSREKEILVLVAKGYANKQIALALSIEEDTVRNHIYSLMSKFEVETRTGAVTYALRQGLLTLEEI